MIKIYKYTLNTIWEARKKKKKKSAAPVAFETNRAQIYIRHFENYNNMKDFDLIENDFWSCCKSISLALQHICETEYCGIGGN